MKIHNMAIQYLSQEKFEELVAEQKQLKEVDMFKTAERIDEARQMGDLSENAEYHAAREKLAWQKARTKEIDAILDNAEIVGNNPSSSEKVELGSSVVVDMGNKEKTYTLVGVQEADPLEGKISNESPIGTALLGKKVGDKVKISLPAGEKEYTILSIS